MTNEKPAGSKAKPHTIKDVAREAGVSIASVSRVMNGHNNVQPETRDRIAAVIDRLRYSPHLGARELITKRSHVIGVLLPDLYGEFFSELIRGIDTAARAQKLHLLLSSAHGDAAEMVTAIQAMRGRVEGLLIMAPHLDTSLLSERLDAAIPVVFMNSKVQDATPSLSIDNYRGARAMVRHLVACGHRSIAHLSGPIDNFDSHQRLRGYRDELAASLPKAAPMILSGDFTETSGYAAGRRLATATPRPAAVFAANDMMAIGCLAALDQAGIDVPGQIAVAGFDDIPLAAFVRPALTTVRVHIAELGRDALRQLAATIEGTDLTPAIEQLPQPEPVVRESCGAHFPARPTPRRRRAFRHGGHDGDHQLVDTPQAAGPPASKPRKGSKP
jgi:LacI family transcriptional regulator